MQVIKENTWGFFFITHYLATLVITGKYPCMSEKHVQAHYTLATLYSQSCGTYAAKNLCVLEQYTYNDCPWIWLRIGLSYEFMLCKVSYCDKVKFLY